MSVPECVVCGRPAPPGKAGPRAQFPCCSKQCRWRMKKARRRGESLALFRGRRCMVCGAPIPPERTLQARHCSHACEQVTHLRNRREDCNSQRVGLPDVMFVCRLLRGLPSPAARVRWLQARMPEVLAHLEPRIRDRIAHATTALYLRRRRLPTPIHKEHAA